MADKMFRNAELKKKRTFRKFSYRGIDLDQYAPLYPLLNIRCRQLSCPLYSTSPNVHLTNTPTADSSTSPPNSSVTSSMPVRVVGSTAVSSASLWA